MNFLKLKSVLELPADLLPTLDASKTTTSGPVLGFDTMDDVEDFLIFFEGVAVAVDDEEGAGERRERKSRSCSGTAAEARSEETAFRFFESAAAAGEDVVVDDFGLMIVLTSLRFLTGAGAAMARALALLSRTRSITMLVIGYCC